jgi:hypothetical protein
MRRLIPLVVALWLAPFPAAGTSHWYPCVAEPTYECLIGHAAAEAALVPERAPRAFATVLVAGAQAVGGMADEARESAEDARVMGSIISDDGGYDFLIAQIVWAKAWAGDLALAGDMLGWISDPYALALGYAALAEAQARHGYPGNAERSMGWAMEEAAKVTDGRGPLAYRLAISHAYVGDLDGMHALIAEARQLADAADTAYGRALPFAAGAVAEAMAGHIEESDALLAEAEARLAEVEDETEIAILASYMAWALAEAGDAEGARGMIQQLGQLNLALLTYHRRALIFAYAALALSGTR